MERKRSLEVRCSRNCKAVLTERFLQGYGDHKNCEKTSDGEREREERNSLRNEGQPKGSLPMTAAKRNSGCYDRRHDLGC